MLFKDKIRVCLDTSSRDRCSASGLADRHAPPDALQRSLLLISNSQVLLLEGKERSRCEYAG
jgi:hypothetical protein